MFTCSLCESIVVLRSFDVSGPHTHVPVDNPVECVLIDRVALASRQSKYPNVEVMIKIMV